jgi:glycosyltransferase involved in cell wall biosynthesis
LPRHFFESLTLTLKTVSLVIPFFNEGQGVAPFFQRLMQTCHKLKSRYAFQMVCINDGSTDATLDELVKARQTLMGLLADDNASEITITIIDFSRNFGKEAALTAGIDHATGDAVIPMDADLQHPPELLPVLLEKWEEGYEVVLAQRTSRHTDHFAQKFAARLFYKLHQKISQIHMPADVGDFRLMDRRVVDAVKQLRENNRFMKGIFAWVGFKSVLVPFEVEARSTGHSSFNVWKLWNLALDGITSFSTVPLRVWTYLGGLVSLTAFLYASYIFVRTLVYGVDTPGYASLMIAILFLGGVQLIGIGVLGEYLGRVYSEVKARPTYIIRQIIS